MEKEFTFIIERHDYEKKSKIKKSFENSYGNWNVMIKVCSSAFNGYVVLQSKLKIPESLLKKVKINLNFLNSRNTLYNKMNVSSSHIPDTSSFMFYSEGLLKGFCSYRVDIKIDTLSLLVMSDYKELCGIQPLIEYTEKMYEDGNFADITIKTTYKREIKAHKIFLSRSKVFDAMLNNHDTKEAQKGIIEIEDIDHDVLVEMVRYLYTDEIPKIKEMTIDLLIAGNKYDISGLVSECESYLAKNVSIESFAEVLIVADQLQIHKLKEAAIKYVVDNLNTVFATEDWAGIKENYKHLAMEVIGNSV